jgi:hypothetical protein
MTMQGGAGDSGAGGGAPAAGGAPAPAPAGAPSAPAWLEGVPEDLTGWVNEQGFKSPADVIASQRGLMRMKGVPPEELVRVQKGWDEKPETAAEVYARLGRPEKAEGYELPDVQVGEGGFDLTPGYRTKAHELGLSARQAKGIAEWFTGTSREWGTQRSEALELRDTQQELALKAEWGGAFDENLGAGKRAWASVAKAAGLDTNDIGALQQSLGYAKVMKLFASMGRALGEHEPVAGETELAFGMTPVAANAKADAILVELMKMDRSDPGYQAKLQESNRYRHMATQEQVADYMKPRG